MSELSILKEAFSTGNAPAGFETKRFQKFLKKYTHLINPKFVCLYPIRDCAYDNCTYRVFAMPLNAESIDEETLEAIKEEINTLPVGSIRYNAAGSGERSINMDGVTGNYLYDEKDTDDVMAISNHFDGIVLFTTAAFDRKFAELDCSYAIFGKWDGSGFLKWDGHTILSIENRMLGKSVDEAYFAAIPDTAMSGDPQLPGSTTVGKAVSKYVQIMQYVFYILAAIGAIWYFFFR